MPSEQKICGRCYDESHDLMDANCDEKPETQINLGMYHCPDCGAMVLGRYPHPKLCGPCRARQHPMFDADVDTGEDA